MTGFPDSLPRAAGDAKRLARARDLHALSGDAAPGSAAVATLLGDAGARFTVLRGAAPAGAIAVYVDPASQAIAVPTGRVFVRFAAGVVARTQAAALAAAGYRIAALLDYAENAAWLEAQDGDVAAALRGIDRLAALAGVERVEPQLLAPRAWR